MCYLKHAALFPPRIKASERGSISCSSKTEKRLVDLKPYVAPIIGKDPDEDGLLNFLVNEYDRDGVGRERSMVDVNPPWMG